MTTCDVATIVSELIPEDRAVANFRSEADIVVWSKQHKYYRNKLLTFKEVV